MAIIKKLGDGLIQVSGFSADGLRIRERFSRKRYGPKLEEIAQARYEELLFENSGLISYSIGKKAKNFGALTVEVLAKRYVEEHLRNTKSYGNKSYVDLITAKWGKHRLKHISIGAVRPWVYSLLNQGWNGEKKSPYSVKKVVRYFQRMFNWGCEIGIIEENPLRYLLDLQLKKWFKRMTRGRRVSIDAEYFFDLVEKFPIKLRRMTLIAWYTGMRAGEICGLKWSNIHGDLVEFHPADDKEVDEKIVVLEPEAMAIFQEIQAEQIAGGGEGMYVFPDAKGNATLVYNLSNGFHDNCRKAGASGIRFHDIRHFYEQRKRREGFHSRIIRAQLGHHSPAMDDVYDDITLEERRTLSRFDVAKNGKFPADACLGENEGGL